MRCFHLFLNLLSEEIFEYLQITRKLAMNAEIDFIFTVLLFKISAHRSFESSKLKRSPISMIEHLQEFRI